MDQRSDESILRDRVGALMREGRLPRRLPDRIWGVPGTGTRCMVCGGPLQHDEVVWEAEFRQEHGPDNLRVHMQCFAAWEAELEQPNRCAATPPGL